MSGIEQMVKSTYTQDEVDKLVQELESKISDVQFIVANVEDKIKSLEDKITKLRSYKEPFGNWRFEYSRCC